tara:strand:+ start:343 stop:639 length:297 start_codon:yes stop_codon:yes gene_type:complete
LHFKDFTLKIYYIGLLIGPIVLFVLPASFFDTGKSVCLSVALLDQECYGCGMTRGLQHLIHGEVKEAHEFNKLSSFVLVVLIVLWIIEMKKLFNRRFH